ncbi:hypothetical protein [Xenorhabdus khoisanae]|uniref:hypothetical protein n=1 Tax=Xenorhabdus khoisanae TaxID=880157 RepID=UPI003D6F31D1
MQVIATIAEFERDLLLDNKFELSKSLIDYMRKIGKSAEGQSHPCIQPFGYPCEKIK